VALVRGLAVRREGDHEDPGSRDATGGKLAMRTAPDLAVFGES